MSFGRYPLYKPTQVLGLNEVPASWDVRRADAVLTYKRDMARVETFRGEEVFHYSIPSIQDTGDGTYESGAEILSDKIALRGNELLVSKLNPRKGVVLLTTAKDVPMVCSTEFVPMEANGCDLRYGFWLYSSEPVRSRICAEVQSVTRSHQRANPEDITKLWLPFPPFEEQVAISAFLDTEAAKLDTLVAEQRRLIALLREKRQAVITHAITQGIDASVHTKPSSIPSMPDIPTHWEVRRIKHVVRSVEQGWSPQCDVVPTEDTEEWGVLKVGCVNGGTFDPTENKKLPDDLTPLPELGLIAGDVLVSRANTRDLVGSAAVVSVDYPRLMLCDKLYRLRVKPDTCEPAFLAAVLQAPVARGWIEIAATGASASMVNIAQSTILDLPLALPPVAEQRAILAAVDARTAALDALLGDAGRAIALLQERRAALITSAVTGQINVRQRALAGAAAPSA